MFVIIKKLNRVSVAISGAGKRKRHRKERREKRQISTRNWNANRQSFVVVARCAYTRKENESIMWKLKCNYDFPSHTNVQATLHRAAHECNFHQQSLYFNWVKCAKKESWCEKLFTRGLSLARTRWNLFRRPQWWWWWRKLTSMSRVCFRWLKISSRFNHEIKLIANEIWSQR